MGGYTHRELDITGSNPGDLGKDVSILRYSPSYPFTLLPAMATDLASRTWLLLERVTTHK